MQPRSGKQADKQRTKIVSHVNTNTTPQAERFHPLRGTPLNMSSRMYTHVHHHPSPVVSVKREHILPRVTSPVSPDATSRPRKPLYDVTPHLWQKKQNSPPSTRGSAAKMDRAGRDSYLTRGVLCCRKSRYAYARSYCEPGVAQWVGWVCVGRAQPLAGSAGRPNLAKIQGKEALPF